MYNIEYYTLIYLDIKRKPNRMPVRLVVAIAQENMVGESLLGVPIDTHSSGKIIIISKSPFNQPTIAAGRHIHIHFIRSAQFERVSSDGFVHRCLIADQRKCASGGHGWCRIVDWQPQPGLPILHSVMNI